MEKKISFNKNNGLSSKRKNNVQTNLTIKKVWMMKS